MALDELQRHERAERIKQLREESPFTQEAIADRIGVKLRTYQKWEEGGGITWDHLESLADLHKVDVQFLHRGETRERPPDPFASQDEDRLARMEERLQRIQTMLESVAARLDEAEDEETKEPERTATE